MTWWIGTRLNPFLKWSMTNLLSQLPHKKDTPFKIFVSITGTVRQMFSLEYPTWFLTKKIWIKKTRLFFSYLNRAWDYGDQKTKGICIVKKWNDFIMGGSRYFCFFCANLEFHACQIIVKKKKTYYTKVVKIAILKQLHKL